MIVRGQVHCRTVACNAVFVTEASGDPNPPYEFRFRPAPDDLAPFVNSLYYWETSQPYLADVLPAYSGQLIVFPEGDGEMRLGGSTAHTIDAFVLCPLTQAWPFDITGPSRMFGVSLNFRGWAALTGLDVSTWHDQMLDPDVILAQPLAEEMGALAQRWRAGRIDDEALFTQLCEIVRQGLKPIPEKHALLIDRTLEWLSSSFNPELDALYSSLPFSQRQSQRLIAQFFGQSPISLVRRYRAVRAATLLSLPDVSDDIVAQIRDAFFDQAHLIRELRHFTGRTPRLLQPPTNTVISDMLGPDGYGAVDLFGGTQDQQLASHKGPLEDC